MNAFVTQFSNFVLLTFVVGLPLFATWKKINVFDSFILGAKQGFEISVNLIPYLIAMLVAIGMLRASGFFEIFSQIFSPFLSKIGMPPELLPLAMIRPFSGSAATGLMAELIHQHGGDSFIGKTAATIMGSTETTFYVVAVYFGAVGIRRTRHAIPAGLLADLAGVIAAIFVCKIFFLP